MNVSWADQCRQNKPETSTLKITYNRIRQKNDDQKIHSPSKIPLHVRYEKELNSDDDMILYGNNDDSDNKNEDETNTIMFIPNEQFLMNHFQNTEQMIFFQLTVPFLDADDILRFVKCCKKYAKMFRSNDKNDNLLLFVWKHLYSRDYGSIKFQRRRRCKQTRQQQMEKYKQKINNYLYWKQQYQLRNQSKFIIKYNNDRLSFYRSLSNVRTVDRNDMIIVTVHKCKRDELLEIDNFIWSNWYDIDDAYLWKFRRRYGWYMHTEKIYRKRIDIAGGYHGFKDLNVDTMMENVYISHKGTRGYVYPVRYIKLKCYLIGIASLNKMYCLERRHCTLLSKERSNDEDDEVIHGLILNRILNVDELESKMLECMRRRKRLSVLVYAMAFGLSNEYSMRHFNKDSLDQYDVNYVVVDYYDNEK